MDKNTVEVTEMTPEQSRDANTFFCFVRETNDSEWKLLQGTSFLTSNEEGTNSASLESYLGHCTKDYAEAFYVSVASMKTGLNLLLTITELNKANTPDPA